MPQRFWDALFVGCILATLFAGPACNVSLPDGMTGAELPAPDGIDPRSPNIERTTTVVDFTNTRTIRLEIPTGRVSISQESGETTASLKVTKTIVREGLGHDVLEAFLNQSNVSAERSFVDDTRLDIEATVAEGLSDTDIVFDLRLVVPTGVSVEVLVGNGPVEVTNLTGNVEVRTNNGQVVVNAVDGNVVAHTTNRSISILDPTGNVKAITTDADVTVRTAPPPAGQISAETTSGTIRLAVDPSTAASLSLASAEGTVTANLSGFAVTEISTGAGILVGVLNGGGGRIEAQTLTGDIEFLGI